MNVMKKVTLWVMLLALLLTGCAAKQADAPETTVPETNTPAVTDSTTEAVTNPTSEADATEAVPGETFADGVVLGTGATVLQLTVVDAQGKETHFTVNTDQTTVGLALQEVGIVDGEMGDYGLYIKSVNGMVADYDVDGSYWAFYLNGAYAASSADQTPIDPDTVYMLKMEKA